MNYVGQLAGQVFVQVKELYRGLNPATLSGCIDVIVVRQPDGSLQCSPFHVRFGKMGVLRSREKVVDIEINGEPVSLHMKLGENGEAFFVTETEDTLEVVPAYLATSPIMTVGEELMQTELGRGASHHHDNIPCSTLPVQSLGPQDGATLKKRRRRRRKARPQGGGGAGGRREDSGEEFSEDEDMFTIDLSSDEEKGGDSSRPAYNDLDPTTNSNSYHMTEWTESQSNVIKKTLSIHPSFGLSISCPQSTSRCSSFAGSPDDSASSTPKSDSELTNQTNPEMLWTWGELPQAAQPSFLASHQKHDSAAAVSIPLTASSHFRAITDTGSAPEGPCGLESAQTTAADGTMDIEGNSCEPWLKLQITSEQNSGEENVKEAENVGPSSMEVETACSMSLKSLPGHLTEESYRESPVRNTDSPSKRKEKRSQHLGADGVYLDDITELEPEVAALYFPKSDGGGSSTRGDTEIMMDVRGTNQSPQSVGSSGVDSGVDSLLDQIADLPHVAISLCGGLSDNKEITKEQFLDRAVSYQQFSENPSIIDDPNLVVKVGNKYYNWTTAAPVMLAMQVYQKPLPQCWCLSYVFSVFGLFSYCFPGLFGSTTSEPASVENIMKEKMPKKGGRWWFSWRRRNSDSKSETAAEMGDREDGSLTLTSENGLKDDSSSSDEDHTSCNQMSESFQPEPVLNSAAGVCYKKTLRLTSDQLVSLQLKEGPNEVVFSVTTQYQGTCRCHGTIYLWSWDDKIIISDIDGTITRSDTLGHILPTLGKDWTHQGIARLYHRVSLNGYKFMYCSARAIGMAGMTRGYLHWVNERGTMLPLGPVLLSPSSLFSAFHREIIEKKPELFKIECLTDIKHLFYPNTEPFYAAFGNRATDVYSYKEVGIPLNRIFTVNPKGELIQEHAKTNISSFGRLCEMVDHVFPVLLQNEEADIPSSDSFDQNTDWRKQLPDSSSHEEDESQPIEAN
ncbi:phosphatidate phosphatase LPIN1 isoform X2 [Xiphophorus hellerii]|uniref:phosphatidate phosphatase LPIN1 isoform X2 n=1 Tax=Xiphophorus hellerii TaxID=8084 RepID=UPI0013B40985|nr:phosphatidate phosphatase LPIN1-like isoform X2 [Xiphophorus hellerii]